MNQFIILSLLLEIVIYKKYIIYTTYSTYITFVKATNKDKLINLFREQIAYYMNV